MLQLIIGRSGSGKTTALYDIMRQAAETADAPLVLLVPEQASFENERRLLTEFGPVLSQRIQVLSFTRLAETVFRKLGGAGGERMDSTLSLLIMRQALLSVADSLTLYRHHVDSPDFLRSILDFLTECKQCAITPKALADTAAALPDGMLRQKTADTALILQAYEALVAGSSLCDPQDDLSVLVDRLPTCSLFDGAHLYVDAFKGFTEQELQVLDRLLSRAASMTVCLCTDTVTPTPYNTLGRFSTVIRTATRLRDMAARHHVPVAPIRHLTENQRTTDSALRALEAGCFLPRGDVYEETTDRICVTPCADRVAECRYAAREIRRLLRENGGHCRDFTIVTRDSTAYSDLLASALEREGLPFTLDLREPIVTQPLITLIESALAAALSWDSTDILRLLKTGLAGFSTTSASQLENYVFLWNIRGKQWKVPFTAHPDGMGEKEDERSAARLTYLNILRHRLAEPLMHLQTKLAGNRTGKECAEAVWTFLQNMHVPRTIRLTVARLKAAGDIRLAEQQARLWDHTVTLLDKFAALTTPVTAVQFAELFRLAVNSEDLGNIPSTLDGVNVGGADRIRYAAPKTVLILGANEGVFPAYVSSGGLLSDRERTRLIQAGLPMTDHVDLQTAEERFYAYAALAAPSERLIITYAQTISDEPQKPSAIVDAVDRLVPHHAVGEANRCGASESEADAFYRLSALWREDSAEAASLRTVFDTLPAYADRLASLSRAENGFHMQDAALARRLFGDDMRLSATQIQSYHRCRFAHFCQYGLRIKPRKRAALDPAESGTLAHEIMRTLLPVYAARQYVGCTKKSVANDVADAVTAYVHEALGGAGEESARFRGQLKQLIRYCAELMWRVVQELRQSRFVPVDHELPFGYRQDGSLPAWKLTATDGSTIRVIGKIDRVDIHRENGVDYVRVVDYKTYDEKFELSEVLGGLDMQMLIYLFAIGEVGTARYGNTLPAGVLYLPVQLPIVKAQKDIDPDVLAREQLKTMKMNGLLIDDPAILRAMETDLGGVFIPASATKSGALGARSSVASLRDFGRLKKHIQLLLDDMVCALHRGAIDVRPVSGIVDGCQHCKYHDICCHQSGDPTRELQNYSLAQALDRLPENEEVTDDGET